MRTLIILSLIALGSAYTDLNDNEDINEVVNNNVEMKQHIACYLDKGPCNKDTIMYKKHMPEAVDDGCRECNPVEKHMFKLFLKSLKEHFPEDYKDYQKKFDPTGSHFNSLIASLDKF